MVGFYYDFIPSYEVTEPFLHLVEQKMRQLVKAALAIEKMEMESKNAKEYLDHLGHHYAIEENRNYPTTTLFCIRDFLVGNRASCDFADPLAPPFVKNTKEISHFRLYSLQPIGNKRFRILGSVHEHDGDLKEECKLLTHYQKKNHLVDGERADLFHREEKGWIWHPKGLVLKELCVERWNCAQREHNAHCIETVSLHDLSTHKERPSRIKEEKISMHRSFFKKEKRSLPFRTAELFWEHSLPHEEILMEGLLHPAKGFRALELCFVLRKELLQECISSLQFIDKILNMYPFGNHCTWVFSSGRKVKMIAESEALLSALEMLKIPFVREERGEKTVTVEARIQDRLGRGWQVAYLSIDTSDEDVLVIERSSMGILERWIALWVEHSLEDMLEVLEPRVEKILFAERKKI